MKTQLSGPKRHQHERISKFMAAVGPGAAGLDDTTLCTIRADSTGAVKPYGK